MTDTAPLIHIGFHKTGTTLLQDHLFSRTDLGFAPLADARRTIPRAFVLRGGLTPLAATLRDDLRRAHDAARAAGQTLVISHERLSGYPASGGFDQGAIAARLHAVFPQARILMLIREQRAVIASMYLQTISDGGTLPLGRFLAPAEPELLRRPGFRFDYYDYDRVITRYAGLFGADRVLALPFEALRPDADAMAQRIVDFARGAQAAPCPPGVLHQPVNAARPMALQALRRQLNKLTRNQLNEGGLLPLPVTAVEAALRPVLPLLRRLRPAEALLRRRLHAQVAQACAGHYGASNARTAALTGQDLARLGYDVAPGPDLAPDPEDAR